MLNSFSNFDIVSFLIQILVRVFVVLTALPLHEYAHGFVAKKLGDPTASNQGRLRFSPLAHFDIIGTTALILTGYGWAKPVPVNPSYFKDRKKGMALTALAGPVSNLLMATVAMILYKCVYYFVPYNGFTSFIATIFLLMIQINIGLAVFNLLPIPPLDGAKIFGVFIPDKYYWKIMQYERYIMMGLFAVVMFTPILDTPIRFLNNFITSGLSYLTYFIELIAKAVGVL